MSGELNAERRQSGNRDNCPNTNKKAGSSSQLQRIALVGDSDVERWPEDLWPAVNGFDVSSKGRSGALLNEVIPFVQQALQRQNHNGGSRTIIVLCAGENDISSGVPLLQSDAAFRKLVDATNVPDVHVIYLGPKFEPWLRSDMESRKKYIAMSRNFERLCDTGVDHVTYVDCLTMFCGNSAREPGALYGGKADADATYFDKDQLHLFREGYARWKDVVEKIINDQILQHTR